MIDGPKITSTKKNDWFALPYDSEAQDRVMLTGRHIVRDVACKSCNTKLGWIYEFATEEAQRYKEGRVILERALVTEHDGMEEYVPKDCSPVSSRPSHNGSQYGGS